jgi:tetrapyrrole methylase family protein/MazG family protein
MYEQQKERLKSQERYTVDDLRLIVTILRSSEGCPWDREQTHASIIPGMIEEAYEVVEAIEADSVGMLREELGDVLLQIVFHADIEREQGSFDFDDAVTDICRKMIVRHPHVFADVTAKTADVVLENWDKIKAKTKHQQDLGEKLDAIAKPLPALIRTQKVMRKTAKEREIPTPEVSDRLSETELALGQSLVAAISACEASGMEAETVLRRYCDALIETVKKEK